MVKNLLTAVSYVILLIYDLLVFNECEDNRRDFLHIFKATGYAKWLPTVTVTKKDDQRAAMKTGWKAKDLLC